MEGIDIMLAPNGVFVSESQYFLDAFETAFDTVYHEHLRFYLLKPLQNSFLLLASAWWMQKGFLQLVVQLEFML